MRCSATISRELSGVGQRSGLHTIVGKVIGILPDDHTAAGPTVPGSTNIGHAMGEGVNLANREHLWTPMGGISIAVYTDQLGWFSLGHFPRWTQS
jgi:hypothetical protein